MHAKSELANVIDAIIALADGKQPLTAADEKKLDELDLEFSRLHFSMGLPAVDHDPHEWSWNGCKLPESTDGKIGRKRVHPTKEWRQEMERMKALSSVAAGDTLDWIPANDAARAYDLLLPEISKAVKGGTIRGRKPTPEQRQRNERLQVVVPDVTRYAAEKRRKQDQAG